MIILKVSKLQFSIFIVLDEESTQTPGETPGDQNPGLREPALLKDELLRVMDIFLRREKQVLDANNHLRKELGKVYTYEQIPHT